MGISATKKSIPGGLAPAFLCLALAAWPAFGLDAPVARIVDDSAVRARAKDAWLLESPARVLSMPRAVHDLDGGGRVEIRAVGRPGEILVQFARQHHACGQFPGWAQGSWEFVRARNCGAIRAARVFPRSDSNTFVQFRPFGADRVQMDVLIYDAYVVRGQTLPISMDRLSVMPLNDILQMAGRRFPVRYFEPNPDDFRDQRRFVANVRERLPELRFADDGAIDHSGRFVYIATGEEQRGQPGLNCSGFAKWLVDGILRPVTGERMAIPPLKAPFGDRGSSFTDDFEELRDPFFGLDWIRNLASRAGTVLRSPAFGTLEEIEVRRQPFSQVILRRGSNVDVRSFPGFQENAGYGIEGLLPLLYTLAIDEPGRFFLAAVNNDMYAPHAPRDWRGRPWMRQYFHVAALVPYFDERGVFRVAVFESAAETSIGRFKSRYALGHHVNLVRVPLERNFDP
ncbi:MAG: hypothetical protein FWB79_03865 [Treponema sp.]|nr:hypothetical protein [Treponema sp.]